MYDGSSGMKTVKFIRSSGTAPYVVLENATFRAPGGLVFAKSNLSLCPGERWAIVGPSDSGQELLLAALAGKLILVEGRLRHPFLENDARFVDSVFGVLPPGSIAMASMKQHRQLLLAREFHQLRWHGSFTADSTRVREYLERGQVEQRNPFAVTDDEGAQPFESARQREIDRFELTALLDRPLVALSNGELHRLLLARALMLDPGLLLVDEPFAGLDRHSRGMLLEILDALHAEGTGMVLACAQSDDLPDGISHMIEVQEHRIVYAGPRLGKCTPARRKGTAVPTHDSPAASPPLVEFRDVTVRQGAVSLLEHVTFTISPGEHWALVGPNGSGKSTLLSLILADNPQAFANHIRVAGRQLGPGCGIWEIKALLGWVSPELDAHYPPDASALDAVLSGFASSLGVHAEPNHDQRAAALQWLDRLGLAGVRDRAFANLPTCDRRLVLLARAAVHGPSLLILDEPCLGLDQTGRERLLAAIEAIAIALHAGMIFVTHDPTEIPSSVTKLLVLESGLLRHAGPRVDWQG
jgi:ABC-type molybdenum transport system, ATPase component/photorepair protein PhrA